MHQFTSGQSSHFYNMNFFNRLPVPILIITLLCKKIHSNNGSLVGVGSICLHFLLYLIASETAMPQYKNKHSLLSFIMFYDLLVFLCIEKKLQRKRGKNDSAKPKEMIKSLQEARDLHTTQFLASNHVNEDHCVTVDDDNTSVLLSVQRRLHPERQALNPLELVPLVHDDVLSKHNEQTDDKRIT